MLDAQVFSLNAVQPDGGTGPCTHTRGIISGNGKEEKSSTAKEIPTSD